MEHISCALCGASHESIIYQSRAMRVVICRACGLVYMNPRPTEQEMGAYYADDYQHKRHGITTYEQAVARQIKKNSLEPKRERAQQFLPYLHEGATVLEIGSGWGAMLKVLKDEKKARAIGLELSDMGREVAQKHYGVEVYAETLDAWFARTNERVDAVIMNHVLEHIYHPMPFLKLVSEVMLPHGILYVAVPDIMKPHGTPEDYYRTEHAFHYSPWSLARMIRAAGFKIIDIRLSDTDIRCVAVKHDDERKEIDMSDGEVRYGARATIAANEAYQTKYRRLRGVKRIVQRMMPRAAFRVAHARALKALKRLRIISG